MIETLGFFSDSFVGLRYITLFRESKAREGFVRVKLAREVCTKCVGSLMKLQITVSAYNSKPYALEEHPELPQMAPGSLTVWFAFWRLVELYQVPCLQWKGETNDRAGGKGGCMIALGQQEIYPAPAQSHLVNYRMFPAAAAGEDKGGLVPPHSTPRKKPRV